jgi:serine/threonine protein phosphatase PrpC
MAATAYPFPTPSPGQQQPTYYAYAGAPGPMPMPSPHVRGRALSYEPPRQARAPSPYHHPPSPYAAQQQVPPSPYPRPRSRSRDPPPPIQMRRSHSREPPPAQPQTRPQTHRSRSREPLPVPPPIQMRRSHSREPPPPSPPMHRGHAREHSYHGPPRERDPSPYRAFPTPQVGAPPPTRRAPASTPVQPQQRPRPRPHSFSLAPAGAQLPVLVSTPAPRRKPRPTSFTPAPAHAPAQAVRIADYGAAQAMGTRPYQEDAYVLGPPGAYAPGPGSQAFFAVYDGHGGRFVSAHAARALHPPLIASAAFAQGRYTRALRDAFAREDAELAEHKRAEACGAATVVAVVDLARASLVVANAGDSRAVLAVREGGTLRAARMSEDHNPTTPAERARIEAAGGAITTDGRVGTLAVSRSLGDHMYKLHAPQAPAPGFLAALRPGAAPAADLVSGHPHLASAPLSAATPCAVLGSDGLFGVLSDGEVVGAVERMRAAGRPARDIAQSLVDTAVKRWGAHADNVTAVVILFA